MYDGRNNNSRGGFGGPQRNYSQGNGQSSRYVDAPALQIPEEFVDEAMRVMEQLSTGDTSGPGKRRFYITTSKIRRLLTLIMEIYNDEYIRQEAKLLEESKLKLQMARVRMVYEAGRDRDVEKFLTTSKLLSYVKGVGDDRRKLMCLTQYMEALVAYHRYMGGREN